MGTWRLALLPNRAAIWVHVAANVLRRYDPHSKNIKLFKKWASCSKPKQNFLKYKLSLLWRVICKIYITKNFESIIYFLMLGKGRENFFLMQFMELRVTEIARVRKVATGSDGINEIEEEQAASTRGS